MQALTATQLNSVSVQRVTLAAAAAPECQSVKLMLLMLLFRVLLLGLKRFPAY